MTRDDLLGKEMSNLYAIAKQVNHYFNDSDISFLKKRMQNLLSNYVKFSCNHEEQTAEMLRNLQVNPGNTTDSIVNEMTENLDQIVKSDLSDSLKQLSYELSLNRLISYHKANIENIEHLL
ncbi:hypothetical protein [Pseudozobellia sp. WGM2]|uniref:hypothetical protein n=1 Tax=Pseudozobellia sp. WGM2 TaxID=2787625 RepID=UPI001AE011A5|nr:hypothetical protein [Pseudozobellia sp. WGM2]